MCVCLQVADSGNESMKKAMLKSGGTNRSAGVTKDVVVKLFGLWKVSFYATHTLRSYPSFSHTQSTICIAIEIFSSHSIVSAQRVASSKNAHIQPRFNYIRVAYRKSSSTSSQWLSMHSW